MKSIKYLLLFGCTASNPFIMLQPYHINNEH